MPSRVVRRTVLPLLAGSVILFGAAPADARTAKSERGVTTINGEVPPGTVTQADVTRLLKQPLGGGRILYQYRTVRPPGTRAPIHVHPAGGSTCVIEGETTIRIEGTPVPETARAGECVFMPSGPVMVNFNSGAAPFVTIDSFVLRKGQKPMDVVEPGFERIEGEFQR